MTPIQQLLAAIQAARKSTCTEPEQAARRLARYLEDETLAFMWDSLTPPMQAGLKELLTLWADTRTRGEALRRLAEVMTRD